MPKKKTATTTSKMLEKLNGDNKIMISMRAMKMLILSGDCVKIQVRQGGGNTPHNDYNPVEFDTMATNGDNSRC